MKVFLIDIQKNYSSGIMTVVFLMNYRVGRYVFLSRYKKTLLFPVYMMCKFNSRILSFLFGCYLPFSTQLGCSVTFLHGLHGVFISSRAKIGDGCTILHHVTIGSNVGSKKKTEFLSPNIGENVFIGVGAKVIGGVSVGEFSMLGAGSVLCKSVPAYSRVYPPIPEIK
ncbi:serine acetyltransferase [Halomonas marinisediminis]|uniref:Serine acetyltransferase n=1 Tax=Halomonas marinisediminis TaxID=2546095 RepID=A0ABY2D3D8_9GAMM|nr:serine acetyltransferase [Halomonas marinisediminis]TDA95759.1 serine acetyltransferase [Halomonas marinisediminis]